MTRTPEKRRDSHPRAPSQAEWDAMTPEEQARVYAALPGEVTDAELSPPEGDRHFLPKAHAFNTLTGHFRREQRRVYLACELPVYYPDERRFAPDLLAVMDAEPRERDKWVVSAEGRALDLVLEVHAGGDRKKDAERNVARYARLGILWGYRLTGARRGKYVPIKPVRGRLPSKRLGLELQVEDGRLRFYEDGVPLLDSAELIDQLQKQVETLRRRTKSRASSLKKEVRLREETQRRIAEETRRREEESRLLAEETRRREEESRLLAEAKRSSAR